MTTAIGLLIAFGTLAFGAVYPWGFLPLFAAATVLGAAGLRHGLRPSLRPLAGALLLLCLAAVAQAVPLPRPVLETISPAAVEVLSTYSLAFTAATTEWFPLSIDPPRTWIAILALAALSVYLTGLPSLLDERTVRSLPVAMAVMAVPLGLLGIYSREYFTDGLIYGFWEPRDVPIARGGGANHFGPFINRNHFGGWMLMTACLLAGSLFARMDQRRPAGTWRRGRRLAWLSSADANRILWIGSALLVAAISLFWTLSRSAMAGFSVATALFATVAVRRHDSDRATRRLILGSLGAVLLFAAAWRGFERLAVALTDDRSLLSRIEAWKDGWQVVLDFPLAGTGLNTYTTAMKLYQTSNAGFHLAQAHNDYLQLLAEGGLLVTLPAALAIAMLARAIGTNLRAARVDSRGYWIRMGATIGLCAIAVQEVFEFSLQIPANAVLFCTLAALALTPSGDTGGRSPRDTIASPEKGSAVASLPKM